MAGIERTIYLLVFTSLLISYVNCLSPDFLWCPCYHILHGMGVFMLTLSQSRHQPICHGSYPGSYRSKPCSSLTLLCHQNLFRLSNQFSGNANAFLQVATWFDNLEYRWRTQPLFRWLGCFFYKTEKLNYLEKMWREMGVLLNTLCAIVPFTPTYFSYFLTCRSPCDFPQPQHKDNKR